MSRNQETERTPKINEIPELKKILDVWMTEANKVLVDNENIDVKKYGKYYVSNLLKELQDIYAPKIQAEWERVKGNYKEVDGKFVPKDEK